MQSDQGLHCPLSEPLDTTKCINGEETPRGYFALVQDEVRPHILRILEGTIFAWRGPYILSVGTRVYTVFLSVSELYQCLLHIAITWSRSLVNECTYKGVSNQKVFESQMRPLSSERKLLCHLRRDLYTSEGTYFLFL